MGLKYELTEAPEESVASFYKEQDGKWLLDAEGVVPESKFKEAETKLGEFRNNNIQLKQKLEEVTKTSLKDVKPSDIDVEQAVEKRVADMKTENSTLAQQKAQLEAHLERVVLSDSVKDAAIKYGVQESALQDVMNRAKEVFTVKDGVAVLKEAKVDKDGKPYQVTTWIQSLSESAPHLFGQSRGSGSQKTVKGSFSNTEVSGISRIAQGLKNRK